MREPQNDVERVFGVPTARPLTDYAYKRGISAGWSHANWEAAYGSDEPRWLVAFNGARDHYLTDGAAQAAYVNGFAEGCLRFDEDRWQDGTPLIADDPALTNEDAVRILRPDSGEDWLK